MSKKAAVLSAQLDRLIGDFRPGILPRKKDEHLSGIKTFPGIKGKKVNRAMPYQLDPPDHKKAARLALKAAWGRSQQNKKGPLFPSIPELNEADLDFILELQDLEKSRSLFNWVANNLDVADPANAYELDKIFPEYRQSIQKYVITKGKLLTRLALLRNMGPRTKQDVVLLWALDTGLVTFKKEDFNLLFPYSDKGEIDEADERRRYKRGLLNFGTLGRLSQSKKKGVDLLSGAEADIDAVDSQAFSLLFGKEQKNALDDIIAGITGDGAKAEETGKEEAELLGEDE